MKHRRGCLTFAVTVHGSESKQGANQHSIITKANIQKALSVSVLLRHPLPLMPPSLALVFPPFCHPAPPSSVQEPPHPPSLGTSPYRCISPISLLLFPFYLALFLSFSIVLFFCCPSYSYSNAYPSLPHTLCSFSVFLTNLLLMCVYIPPSHSFNSVSLSVLSEGLSWKRLPPTHSLFSFQLDIRFTFTMSKRRISHVAPAHGSTHMQTHGLDVCTRAHMCLHCVYCT